MNEELLIYSGIMLLSTFISSVSQAMLKKSAMSEHDSKLKEYLNPWVISAYALFFLTTLICIIAYRVVPLSFGPVLESTSYLYVTVLGALLFKERITKWKILALAFILVGIAIYALSV